MTETRQPVDEVQALLDDLALMCDVTDCSAAAVWIAWCVCSCSDEIGEVLLLCATDYPDVVGGEATCRTTASTALTS